MTRFTSSAFIALLFAAAASASHAFGFSDVDRRAREVAGRPYVKPAFVLPKQLKDLAYDQTRDIRFDPARSLFRAQKLPFLLSRAVAASYGGRIRLAMSVLAEM